MTATALSIDYHALATRAEHDLPVQYDETDAMLYALAVGFGSDAQSSDALHYVYEGRGLRTVPSLASMLAPEAVLAGCNFDEGAMLHRSQSVQLFRPLSPAGELLANQHIAGVYDRGRDNGAEIDIETELRRARDDTVIGLVNSTVIARADGGFGGPPPPKRERHQPPGRDPDFSCNIPTRPDQALLFRLTGDYNPLHADPRAARAAGFEAPILHGRCTYGIACHAVLRTVCNYDFTLIQAFDARFSAPVIPGDVITTDMWQERNVIFFQCRVAARNVNVLTNGRAVLAE